MGCDQAHVIGTPTPPELGKPFRQTYDGLRKSTPRSIGEVGEDEEVLDRVSANLRPARFTDRELL